MSHAYAHDDEIAALRRDLRQAREEIAALRAAASAYYVHSTPLPLADAYAAADALCVALYNVRRDGSKA